MKSKKKSKIRYGQDNQKTNPVLNYLFCKWIYFSIAK